MKKFWLIGLMIAAMVVPGALFAQVEVANGTIQLAGKIKWQYTYMANDDDSDGLTTSVYGLNGTGIESFNTTNVELDVTGTVGENVMYVIELQSANGMAGAGNGNANEIANVGVRQAYIVVSDLIPMTTVALGTGIMPVTIYQQRATQDYDLIGLPLINFGTDWQQTGVLFAIAPMDMVELDIGYFNGAIANNANNEASPDLEKSWLGKLKIMPVEAAMIEISYISEGFQFDANGRGGTEQQNAAAWVISTAYITDKLEINGDYVSGTLEDGQVKATTGRRDDLNAMGYQITGGYWITDAIEGLIRYEFVDPNTANSARKFPGSKYDQLTYWTLGVNARLNECAEVSVNYVMRGEEGDDADDGSNNALKAAGMGKYQRIDNDLFLIQVQVWQ
jgi:hypothetical protein